MKLKNGCNAAWYELNISAADDCVSACYYGGEKDGWSDEYRELEDYWNSPNMQKIRQINSSPDADLSGGCEGCYFFGHRGEAGAYFPEFLTIPPSDLSLEQADNWQKAVEDYKSGLTRIRSTPLRFYINFGFGCNLSCTMCHQVPRRKQNRRQVQFENVWRWKPYFKRAIDITVIGGEPLILPECVKFIEAIINDPELENVQLTICTNGMVLHRFIELLSKKRKVGLAVSLDTIGDEFEQIRVGADWKQIERNIQEFQATGKRLGYPWHVQNPCMLMKTNVPKLADFAAWSVANGTSAGFYDFISATGIEKTHEQENVVVHPYLLEDIRNWEECFTQAIAILQTGNQPGAAGQLHGLYSQIKINLGKMESEQQALEDLKREKHWNPFFSTHRARLREVVLPAVYSDKPAEEVLFETPVGLRLRPSHTNDHVFTGFMPVPAEVDGEPRAIRVKCTWSSELEATDNSCRFYLQDSKFKTPTEIRTGQNNDVVRYSIEKYYLLDQEVDHVRLVLTPPEKTVESVLPISIEVEITGQKPTFISQILTTSKATLSPIKRSLLQLLVSQKS